MASINAFSDVVMNTSLHVSNEDDGCGAMRNGDVHRGAWPRIFFHNKDLTCA